MSILSQKTSSFITPLMVLLSLLPMLFMGFIAYSVANTILTNQINNNLILYEKRKIETIDMFIKERKLDAFQLANLPEITSYFNKKNNGASEFYGSYISSFLSGSGFQNLILININGEVIYSSNNQDEIDKPVQSIPEYYDAFQASSILMLPYISYSFSQYSRRDDKIFIATPIIDKDRMLGILILSMRKQAIIDVIENNVLDITASSCSGILDEGILKIFSAPKTAEYANYDEQTKDVIMAILKEATQGAEGIKIIKNQKGGNLVAVYRYLPELSMGILTHYKFKRVYSKVIWFKIKIFLLIVLSIVIVVIISYLISRSITKATSATEKALLNVLPQSVINEIKTYGSYRARVIENVSILFIDIVSYSKYALSETPEKLTQVISDLFTQFDEQSDRYDITKIKTIGDAYMAIADSGDERKNATNAVEYALACIKAVKIYNLQSDSNLSIRIGINTGDVMSGVISAKKISYDIWGNNVNIAARFEKASKVNQILLSESTYQLLSSPEKYNLIPEKAVPCKGIGNIDAYSLNPEPKNSE